MTQAATVERFTEVDTSVHPKFFVRFVGMANEMASVQACKRRMADQLEPRVGQRILDLGCGTGDDARALARLVAPGGRVIGVDNSEVMLAEARRRAVGLCLSLEFRLGDAEQRGSARRNLRWRVHGADLDASGGARARTRRDDPGAPAGRQGRRLRFRLGHARIGPSDRASTRKMLDLMADSLRNGRIGRRLPGMFEAAGLREISIAPHTVLMHWAFSQQLFGSTLERAQGRAGCQSRKSCAGWNPWQRPRRPDGSSPP